MNPLLSIRSNYDLINQKGKVNRIVSPNVKDRLSHVNVDTVRRRKILCECPDFVLMLETLALKEVWHSQIIATNRSLIVVNVTDCPDEDVIGAHKTTRE